MVFFFFLLWTSDEQAKFTAEVKLVMVSSAFLFLNGDIKEKCLQTLHLYKGNTLYLEIVDKY